MRDGDETQVGSTQRLSSREFLGLPQSGSEYEEYHPYGTTAWQAPELATVSVKRYKYTGMGWTHSFLEIR